jgi:hypothetical protein
MKSLKIGPCHFSDFQPSDERQDVILEIGAIRGDTARLLVGGGIFGNEPSSQVGNRLRLASGRAICGNVTSEGYFGEPLLCDPPRLVDCELAMQAKGWSTLLATSGPIVEEIDATAGRRDLQAKALQVAVPQDEVAVLGCGPVDNSLCQPNRHPRPLQ